MARVMFLFIFALALNSKANEGLFLKITSDVNQSSVYTAEGYFLGYTPLTLPLPKTPRIFVIKNKMASAEYARLSPEPQNKNIDWNISFAGMVNREMASVTESIPQNEAGETSESIRAMRNSSDYYFNVSILDQGEEATLQTKSFLEDKFLVHFTTCNLAQRDFVVGPTSKFIADDIKQWSQTSKVNLKISRVEKRSCDHMAENNEPKKLETPIVEKILPRTVAAEPKEEQKWDSAEDLLAKLPPLKVPEAKVKKNVSTAFGNQITFSGIFVQIFANPTAGKISHIETPNFKKCHFVKNGARWVRYYYEFESSEQAHSFIKNEKRLPASDAFVRTEMTCLKE